MKSQSSKRIAALKWPILLGLALLAAMFLPKMAVGPSAVYTARLQPALQALAVEQPTRQVRVIVQKANDGTELEALVAELGGTVLNQLSIINAFSAELPAGAATTLAAADGVRWVSLDAPVESAALLDSCLLCPTNYFIDTLGVKPVRRMGLTGNNVGVAIIDSGVSGDSDLPSIDEALSFNPKSVNNVDVYGHGTHVAGIVSSRGHDSDGRYIGLAHQIDLISLKISDESGMAYESDTVAAMQWVLEHKQDYRIRVVNLSLNSTVEQSYHTSPLDAAAEILWFNGIVVIASAGNSGLDLTYNAINAAPANDPFIITVGASDELLTSSRLDDVIAAYSASGVTMDGFVKPDIIAPGTGIISVLSRHSNWDNEHPSRVVLNGEYFRLSGTSMAAPMVTGAVALLLQDEPHLTPDQVKYRLTSTGSSLSGLNLRSYPYLDVYRAVTGATTQSANTGLQASQLLWTGNEPVTWNSVNWNSVNWNSVNWNSVNWNSVNWNSVNWNSVNWNE